ncbi:uncharacterized protein LOC122498133 [Leptopilina heterotoma]|uniref:uncharacterized protein LOC122498133 n=1 Tax=Leptopilina heterotoma TaxID=63436 RepID=UPI001CA95FA6|nr:uncharacterized protein LOC122498133 [Leptopilina heterotoma]
MELLILLLLSTSILAQNYHRPRDLNSEPFMPIYPTFPYSPKLMKRGAERNIATPETQDTYSPKQDPRDASSYPLNNYSGKDSYYSPYNAFSKTPASSPPSPPSPPLPSSYSSLFPSSSLGANSFGSSPFGSPPFGSSPFGASPFGSTAFGANPFGGIPFNPLNNFGNAFQNSQVPQLPPGSFPASNFPNFYSPPGQFPNFYNQYPFLTPGANYPNKKDDDDDDDDRKGKKSKGRYKDDNDDTQFRDGGNFLSSNSKDLDGQSSTYKGSSSFKSNYAERLNGIPNQSANLDFDSDSEIKSQQLEQLMRKTLIKLLAQSVAQQVSQAQYPIYETSTSPNQNIRNNDGYTSGPKTGFSYVINPSIINKPTNQLGSGLTPTTQLITKNPRFPDSQYPKAPGLFLTPLKSSRNPSSIPSPDYGDYESQPSQVDQNYQASSNQEQRASFKSKNLPTQTPQTSSFEYSSYQPTPPTTSSQQKELDNVSINFSNKKDNKRG